MIETGHQYKDDNLIPKGWEKVKLEDICTVKRGTVLKSNEYRFGKVPVIAGGKSPAGFHNLPNRIGKTITISASGANAGYVSLYYDPIFATDCSTISEGDNFSIEFLFYSLKNIQQQIYEAQTGGAQPHIHPKDINPIEILLPSKAEQIYIATTLSDVDSLIVALDKLIAKKDAVKRGTMQQLLTGRKRLPGFSDPWVEEKLGECANIYRGGSPRPIEDYISTDSDGVNWIKIGDVSPTSKYINATEQKIKPSGVISSRRVYKGDFILSNSMSFGRPYILNIDGCIHDGWLVIQDYDKVFDLDFLYYALSSEYVFNQYVIMAAGSSVQNLNKERVFDVHVVYPESIKEQKSIAKILTDMDNEIEALRQKKEKYENIKQGMMQQLLTGRIRLIDDKSAEILDSVRGSR